jgi:adenosylcobinamide-GDP ribazoletransferase
LEILKDPRIGAFALIRYSVYMLLEFALLCELYERGITGGIVWIFALSRCLAAWSAVTMKNARNDGMLAAFTEKADRRTVVIILAFFSMLALAGWLWPAVTIGKLSRPAGLALCLLVTLWYRRMAKNKFGGVTGDTTGYYLQCIELALIAGLLI